MASFERNTLAANKSDKEVGIDPDAILACGVPEEVTHHCQLLTRDPKCGAINAEDFKLYTNIMTSVYEAGGVTALIICAMIFEPCWILSIEDWKTTQFESLWRDKLRPTVHLELVSQAHEYADKSNIVPLLLSAEEQVWSSPKSTTHLQIPKIIPPKRRRSIRDTIKKLGKQN